MMNKFDLYKKLCLEAGTLDNAAVLPEKWYQECQHNITTDLDEHLELAATGNVEAILYCRAQCGLDPFV